MYTCMYCTYIHLCDCVSLCICTYEVHKWWSAIPLDSLKASSLKIKSFPFFFPFPLPSPPASPYSLSLLFFISSPIFPFTLFLPFPLSLTLFFPLPLALSTITTTCLLCFLQFPCELGNFLSLLLNLLIRLPPAFLKGLLLLYLSCYPLLQASDLPPQA